MNFLKGVFSELKDLKKTVAMILLILLTMLLIGPVLIKWLRKIPGVGPVIDKAPGTVAALLAALTLLFANSGHAQEAITDGPGIQSAVQVLVPVARMPDTAPNIYATLCGTVALTAVLGAGVFFIVLRAKRTAWQVRPTALAAFAVIGLALWSAVAVPANLAKNFTGIIIHPSGDAEDTNGLLKLYSANASNYMLFNTNGAPIFYTAGGWLTGWTGQIVTSNVFAGGGYVSNGFFAGFAVGTNSTPPSAPR